MVDSNPQLLGGRYEVRSLIGRGGMATVHLGRDTRLSRLVAVKMLRVDLARDAIFQTRFRREAQAAASLNHPNIVAVYDTGEEPTRGPDGKTVMVPYIVMEYVEGHTVKELLSDGTPVPIPEAIEITSGVLSALEYSHGSGLVHRDIKPGNVMLTNDGKVKVMDFGIARAMTDSQATMTSANAVVGTALYLSPEQARGERIDERSDVYSAGCVLFELLTGRAPFAGDSAVSLAYQHVSEIPPVPSSIAADVPASLDQVVMKALAKDPEQRYASASDMAVDMMRAAEGMPIQAPPIGAWTADTAAQTRVVQSPSQSATQTIAYTGPTRAATASTGTTNDAASNTGAIPVQAKKQSKASLIWVWLLIILAAAMVVAVAYVFLKGNQEEEIPMTSVPMGLVGSTQDQARAAVQEAGLVFVLGDPVATEEFEEGTVAEVSPVEGTELEKGKEVKVSLSSGPGTVEVPAMAGWPIAEAQAKLTELGFVVGDISYEDDPKFPKDQVIRTDPRESTTQPKGSKVNLVVSSGNVEVPQNIIGATQEEATTRLAELTFSVNAVTQYNDQYAAGTVISLSPMGVQPQHTTVTLTVSLGPEPPPEPDPEPEKPQSGS